MKRPSVLVPSIEYSEWWEGHDDDDDDGILLEFMKFWGELI